MGLRRVLKNKQTIFTRSRNDRIHVHGMPVKVHRNDALRTCRDLASNSCRVHVERPRVTIDKNRLGAAVSYGVGGRNISKGRNEDFVSRLAAQGHQGEVQRGRSIVDGDGVFDTAKTRESTLELIDEPPN